MFTSNTVKFPLMCEFSKIKTKSFSFSQLTDRLEQLYTIICKLSLLFWEKKLEIEPLLLKTNIFITTARIWGKGERKTKDFPTVLRILYKHLWIFCVAINLFCSPELLKIDSDAYSLFLVIIISIFLWEKENQSFLGPHFAEATL